MVVEMVPLKGGIGSIFGPPGSARTVKWYIFVVYTANWGMDYATYHLLGEPETTIEVIQKYLGIKNDHFHCSGGWFFDFDRPWFLEV